MISAIPTRDPNSLGLVKVDERPAPNFRYHRTAAEWNNACDSAIQLAETVGTGESGTGSLAAVFNGVNVPRAQEKWSINWDMTALDRGLTDVSSGSGSVVLDNFFNEAGFYVTTGGDVAAVEHSTRFVRGTHSAIFEARVWFNTTITYALSLGMRDAGFLSEAYFLIDDSGTVAAVTSQSLGTSSNDSGDLVALNDYHRFRIELTPPTAQFYIDDELFITLSTGVPAGADEMAPFMSVAYATGAGAPFLDWMEVRGDR